MKLMKTAIAGLAGVLFAAGAIAGEITGAGSTFAAPIYMKWADAYQKSTSNKVNYQGIGSSGGLKQIEAKTVDFAGSDAPLKDEDLAAKGLVQFPTVVGGIVPVINLPGVKAGELVLSGEVLADIYLGKIKKWNDAAIAKLNPKVKLPDTEIAVVRRADGSGTSFVFTNYLSKVNAEWKSKVGEGTTVNWPTGTGGKGNDGVAAFVQRLPGAIGYVESAYAKQNKLTHTALVNAEGKTVEPDAKTFAAAAGKADWSKSFYQILTNEKGAESWPIVAATFVLLPQKPVAGKEAQSADVLKFFDWSFKNGVNTAKELDYIPLPEEVLKKIRTSWKEKVADSAAKAGI